MKILLINPLQSKIINTMHPKVLNKMRGCQPPLGLLYITSYLNKNTYGKHTIKIYDANAEGHSISQIEKTIRKFNPDIVGVQILSFLIFDALDILKIVKKINKNIFTIVGGPHSTLYPFETTNFDTVDFSVMDEGEITFYELVTAIQNGINDFTSIKGIAYKKDNKVIVNDRRGYIENIDEIPQIDRTLLPINTYNSILSNNKVITTMMTSRGCPYKCIYCERFNRTFRAHSPEYVLSEIKNCLDLGIDEIFIHDDTFSIDKERVKKICLGIINQRLNFNWDIRSRVNTMDKELLALLKKAGCSRISYGIESGSQKVLNNLKKGIKVSQAIECVNETKKAGIKVLCDFMIGSPGETKEDLDLTMKFIKETKPDFVQFSVTTPYPGTELYKLALEEGIIKSDVWKEFAKQPYESFNPPLWEEHFNENELFDLLNSMFKKYYLSPQYIIKKFFNFDTWLNYQKNFKGLIQMLKLK